MGSSEQKTLLHNNLSLDGAAPQVTKVKSLQLLAAAEYLPSLIKNPEHYLRICAQNPDGNSIVPGLPDNIIQDLFLAKIIASMPTLPATYQAIPDKDITLFSSDGNTILISRQGQPFTHDKKYIYNPATAQYHLSSTTGNSDDLRAFYTNYHSCWRPPTGHSSTDPDNSLWGNNSPTILNFWSEDSNTSFEICAKIGRTSAISILSKKEGTRQFIPQSSCTMPVNADKNCIFKNDTCWNLAETKVGILVKKTPPLLYQKTPSGTWHHTFLFPEAYKHDRYQYSQIAFHADSNIITLQRFRIPPIFDLVMALIHNRLEQDLLIIRLARPELIGLSPNQLFAAYIAEHLTPEQMLTCKRYVTMIFQEKAGMPETQKKTLAVLRSLYVNSITIPTPTAGELAPMPTPPTSFIKKYVPWIGLAAIIAGIMYISLHYKQLLASITQKA